MEHENGGGEFSVCCSRTAKLLTPIHYQCSEGNAFAGSSATKFFGGATPGSAVSTQPQPQDNEQHQAPTAVRAAGTEEGK